MVKRSASALAGAILAAGAAVLAGCDLPNPIAAYEPAWEAQAPQEEAAAAARGTSVETALAAGALSLERCLEIALAANPQIRRGRWAVAGAAAERDFAAGQRWPQLSAQAGGSYFLDRQRLLMPRAPLDPGIYSDGLLTADLVVSMPIFTGGRIRSEIDAAELLREAAKHHLARTEDELVFNVSSVFYAILGQRRVIASVEFSRKALREHNKLVENLLAVQKAARVDLLRTQVRLADVEQRLIREKNTLAIQRRVLANLLGANIELGAAPPDVEGELDLVADLPELAAAEQQALRARRDYQAARVELEAQKQRLAAARATRWPEISLEGSYGGRWAAGPGLRQGGANRAEDVGRIGIFARLPFFTGGRVDAQVRRQRYLLNELQEGLRKLQLDIHLEVESALLDAQANRERVDATRQAVEQAEESLRIEREKYELGRGTITDVLDAQSALLDSQTTFYQALAAYDTTLARYRLAVGERR